MHGTSIRPAWLASATPQTQAAACEQEECSYSGCVRHRRLRHGPETLISQRGLSPLCLGMV